MGKTSMTYSEYNYKYSITVSPPTCTLRFLLQYEVQQYSVVPSSTTFVTVPFYSTIIPAFPQIRENPRIQDVRKPQILR
jgi:hypothetical protein